MTKKKNIRTKGKISFSSYFKNLKENDNVAVVQEKSIPSAYPKRIIGRTGRIIGTRGTYKVVKINDGNLPKDYIIHPIHLKKIK
jgi:ribosomal protein L21E